MKLDKAQKPLHTQASEKIGSAHDTLSEAVTAHNELVSAAVVAFNAAVTAAHTELVAAATAYNTTAEEVREGLTDIGNDLRSEFEDKSEKWQEGDKGQAADEWIQKFEDPTDIVADYEVPEVPNTINADDYRVEEPTNPLDEFPGEADGE